MINRGRMRPRWHWLVALILLVGIPHSSFADSKSKSRIRIGVMKTVFPGMSSTLVRVVTRPLLVLLKSQTGLYGEVQLVDSPEQMAKLLKEKTIQLGVFHGFELGWAQQSNANLKPMLIAIRKHEHLRACLVVHKESQARNSVDLKGKILAIPRRSRAHCPLYLERRCVSEATDPKDFFSNVAHPILPDETLYLLAQKKVDAVVVDKEDLEKYQQEQPKISASLRVLQESEIFPAGVLAYDQSKLSPETATRIQRGMMKAGQTAKSKNLLRICRITSFKAIPSDYVKLLNNIVKLYPPHVATVPSVRKDK